MIISHIGQGATVTNMAAHRCEAQSSEVLDWGCGLVGRVLASHIQNPGFDSLVL